MKTDKLKRTRQVDFGRALLEQGMSRKQVVERMMEEFSLTRRTATTYTYLWFGGDEYKVAKQKEEEPVQSKSVQKREAVQKASKTKATPDKSNGPGWEF